MKKALYFCRCGTEIASRMDEAGVCGAAGEGVRVAGGDFLCSAEGQAWMAEDLRRNPAERVVVAACSPRDHERTFQRVMEEAGQNAYGVQLVNIREHVAWVTPDVGQATEKAARQVRAALERVERHEDLRSRQVAARTEAVVVGAGPAGLRAALTLAEAGRRVTLVEKSPAIGGMAVLFEELYPDMECGPCLLEPMMSEILHGEPAARIELLTLAEVVAASGYQGNFEVTVRERPRYIAPELCIGCVACVEACPEAAIAYSYAGALPNAPVLEMERCVRRTGEDCRRCEAACPVPGAVKLDDQARERKVEAGSVVLATGARLYDLRLVTELGYGRVRGVVTSLEFERMLASNGPADGQLGAPGTVALVHCAGSLDERHLPYCSAVCCAGALKLSELGSQRAAGARFIHLHRELVLPGKEEFAMHRRACANERVELRRYERVESVEETPAGVRIRARGEGGAFEVEAELVVLMGGLVPAEGTAGLARLFEAAVDEHGFFEERHGRLEAARSRVPGVFLAGTCQGPMDIQGASSQGLAAAGAALSSLVEGRRIEVGPVKAKVREARCSTCHLCHGVCPYHAITYLPGGGKAQVSDMLCHGCGVCVAACPSGAIEGLHFTDGQILAELEGLLR